MAEGIVSLGVLAWLFLIVLAILWIALPFAVFGIKGRLDSILKELKKLNAANDKLKETRL